MILYIEDAPGWAEKPNPKPKYPVEGHGVSLQSDTVSFEGLLVHHEIPEGVIEITLVDVIAGFNKYTATPEQTLSIKKRIYWPGLDRTPPGAFYAALNFDLED